MIYFTSDTHFNQERTMIFSKRPFSSLEDMNNTLVNNWNSKITKK